MTIIYQIFRQEIYFNCICCFITDLFKIKNKPQNAPSKTDAKWEEADGLFLDYPRGALLKELAQGDTKRSFLVKGFSFMIVAFGTKQQRGNQLL